MKKNPSRPRVFLPCFTAMRQRSRKGPVQGNFDSLAGKFSNLKPLKHQSGHHLLGGYSSCTNQKNPKVVMWKTRRVWWVLFFFNRGELEEKQVILISEFSVSLSALCQNIKLFPCCRRDLYIIQRDARLHNIYIVFILYTAHPSSPFLLLHLRLQNCRKYLLILLLPLTLMSRNNFYTPKWPNPTIICHFESCSSELSTTTDWCLLGCSSCFCRIQLQWQLL